MVPRNKFREQRRLLREQAECRFVDSDEFCSLLLGFRRLVRADEAALEVRGLLDPDTGTRFLIEQEKLTPPAPHHS